MGSDLVENYEAMMSILQSISSCMYSELTLAVCHCTPHYYTFFVFVFYYYNWLWCPNFPVNGTWLCPFKTVVGKGVEGEKGGVNWLGMQDKTTRCAEVTSGWIHHDWQSFCRLKEITSFFFLTFSLTAHYQTHNRKHKHKHRHLKTKTVQHSNWDKHSHNSVSHLHPINIYLKTRRHC